MAQWAKLHSKTAESQDVADLAAEDPLSALLFLMGLPQAAPWGVLPGSPALFRAKVCPLMDVSLEQVKTTLRLLVEHSMVIAYSGRDGKPLVAYTNWDEHQEMRWDRVGLPEHDLPPGYKPSASLLAAIERPRKADAPAISASRWSEFVAPAPGAVEADSGSSPGVVRDNSGRTPLLEVEVEVEIERQRLARLAARATSENLFGEPPAAEVEPKSSAPTKTETPQQVSANAVLAVYGLKHTDLGKDASKYFSAVGKLVQEHGCEQVDAWASEQGAGSRTLATGQKHPAITAALRKELTAASWSDTFAAYRAREKIAKAEAIGEPLLACAGCLKPMSKARSEDDWDRWTKRDRVLVQKAFDAGQWDQTTGRPKAGVKLADYE
jgi:hypothetical protein